MNRLPPPSADWCLFLDFDGTLVELRQHPEEVEAPDSLARLLIDLLNTFGGAVAIISGRSVAGLERLLAPLQLPLGGVHGLERRDAHGVLHRQPEVTGALEEARGAVARFARERNGLHWEDKGSALAVHYREAPERAQEVQGFLESQRQALGSGYHVQAGKAVFELKPTLGNKGQVIRDFLDERPFAGRTPVFVGDDVTDEDAFVEVNRHGGVSIRIGDAGMATQARYRLDSVEQALAWLGSLPRSLGAGSHAPATGD